MNREVLTYELSGQTSVDQLFRVRYARFLRNGPYIYIASSHITHLKGAELLPLDQSTINDAGYLEANSGAFPTLLVRDYADTLKFVKWTGYGRDDTMSAFELLLRYITINDAQIKVVQ
jgi:hypothetical protein